MKLLEDTFKYYNWSGDWEGEEYGVGMCDSGLHTFFDIPDGVSAITVFVHTRPSKHRVPFTVDVYRSICDDYDETDIEFTVTENGFREVITFDGRYVNDLAILLEKYKNKTLYAEIEYEQPTTDET